MLAKEVTPSLIVRYLDQYVIGQEAAKKVLAVAVYSHYRKISLVQQAGNVAKSNVLLIGNSGTGKTLMCETLSRMLGVPFVTANATSLAQTQYVNQEIEAALLRLIDRAGGDRQGAARHRFHRRDRQAQGGQGRGACNFGRERSARPAQNHGGRAGQV